MDGISLILPGGGARGFSIAGSIKCLYERDIWFSSVSGSSIGAIIGAAICEGKTPDEIKEKILSFKFIRTLRPSFRGSGVLSSCTLRAFIDAMVDSETFEQLKIPLGVVATNMTSGQTEIFAKGDLKPALLASCTLVGFFESMVWNGTIYGDGGYSCPIPFGLFPERNIELVIDSSVRPDWNLGIDRGFRLWGHLPFKTISKYLLKSYDITYYHYGRCQIAARKCIVIEPRLGDMRAFDISKREFAIEAGRRAAERKVAEVLARVI
ncbi:patatin-like phospholipase family protein [Pleomorphomonas sp. NRK KF1]|uniref:patatin-like phospholipase family protein n=1 Tax=Pleomorphomonas sp. NRK KF1 TaxID=2943000 RepID=UPI0020431EF5|nr:patatin-like phospholipase family protein [Pleomorphomonas sp. NRK KF1]MCM5555604.1 patatin-like phospholipase family protein [Pleomorphomonas sp. NRK KF1]